LLLLRQFISVLPMILAALIMVYLATRFRKLIVAAGLFILILSLPGVVRNNHNFWHPDALNLLFIVLTLYFLDRDRMCFGRNFYLAAIACGLSAATRLYGFFFFLAIAGYLAAGWIKHVLRLRQLAGRAAVFALVMAATILLSNPFLFDSGARANLVRIMRDKNVELSSGYNDPDPEQVYRTGWDAWLPYFEQSYASNLFSVFLLVSAAAGAAAGNPPDRPQRVFNAILLAWVLVVTGYLVYFVSVKSTHYMLPLFVPLYAAAFSLPSALEGARYPPFVRKAAWGLVIIFFLAQLAIQLAKIPNALN
jgi:4-amino-4-deoxy-L-arabinose transferase-like glycosyltransferase